MRTSYRKYTEEFKLDTLQLLETSGKSAAQIERELGITSGLLCKWRQRYQINQTDHKSQVLESSDIQALQVEVKRLQRKLAITQQERDILKKAVSIFSQQQK